MTIIGELQAENANLRARVQDLEARLTRDIGAHERTDKIFADNSDHLLTLFETMAQGVVYQDASGTITLANPAAEWILGLSLDELQGRKPLNSFWHVIREDGSDLPGEQYPARVALHTGQPVNDMVIGICHPEPGTRRWILVNAVPEFQSDALQPHGVITTFTDITKRKLVEDTLQSSQQALQLFVEHAPAAIAMFDCDMKYIAASRRFLIDYQLGDQQIIGRSHYEVFPEISQRWKEIHRRCLAGAVEKAEADPFPRADGSLDWVRWEIHPWQQPNGEIGGIILFSEVITDRIQAQAALIQSEAQYRSLFENMAEGYAYCQMLYENEVAQDWIYISVNAAFENLTGLRDVSGKRVSDVIPGIRESDPGLFEIYSRVALTSSPEKFEIYVTALQAWFSVSVYCPIQGSFVAVFDVITERKQAEKKLRDSETKFSKIFQASPVGINIFRLADNRSVEANETYLELIGYSRDEVVGHSAAELNLFVNPESRLRWMKSLRENRGVRNQDAVIRCKNGEIRHALASIDLIEVDGESFGLVITSDITDRKQAEKALHDSQARYRGLFEDSPISIWEEDFSQVKLFFDNLRSTGVQNFNEYFDNHPQAVRDCAGLVKVLDVNRAAVGLMDTNDKSDLLKELGQTLSDTSLGTFKRELISFALGKSYFEGEEIITTATGGLKYVLFHINVAPGSENTLERVIVSIIDITERKRAENEAIYRQKLLEKVIQLGKNITAITDLDQCLREIYRCLTKGLEFSRAGIFLYDVPNKLICGTYGTSRTGQMEKNDWYVKPVDEWTDFEAVLNSPNGIAVEHDFQAAYHPAEDDEMYGVKDHVSLAAWAGDRPVAMLAVDNLNSQRDITTSDVEALQLFAGYAGLAIENAHLHAGLEQRIDERTAEVQDLYDNAPCGYHSLDADGRIVMINQTELNWLGYARAELLGRQFIEFISPTSRAVFQASFPDFQQQGLMRDLEFEIYRKDGSAFPIMVSATAIYDKAGRYVMSRSTVFDNTEHKKAEIILRNANSELERAMRMKDEFLASMSHELRTPLTGILGLSEALQLKSYGELSEKQLIALKNIENSGRHLLDLINDILDLSRIEAGKLEMQFGLCSLADICQASLQLTKGMANKKRHNVSFSMNPGYILVYADARRLKQMLVNLLSNAIKFTPEDGLIGLEVQASSTEQVVKIVVWDKGIGIAPENTQYLFEPFVQLDSSLARQYEGTGLGLSLVRRMAELQGGSVSVESTLGAGSRFTILLPWSAEEIQALPRSAHNTPALSSTLTIYDNEVDAGQLTRYLHNLGIENFVHPVWQGVLETAARIKPGAIFLDLHMPVTSSLGVLTELEADPRTSDIPIVVCSNEGGPTQALFKNSVGYLSRPFTLLELRSELNRVMTGLQAASADVLVPPDKTTPLVMIVDDNELAIEIISDFLASQDLRVVAARSGMELLNIVSDHQPDIILMDIQMPGMDGLEATRRIRAHADPHIAQVPIIALTALAMPGDRERCLAAGANMYLSKPVGLVQMAVLIKKLIEPAGTKHEK